MLLTWCVQLSILVGRMGSGRGQRVHLRQCELFDNPTVLLHIESHDIRR